jgi:hypothetical protein
VGWVTAFAGPAPCCLIVESVVIARAEDADGMAVVREDPVVLEAKSLNNA